MTRDLILADFLAAIAPEEVFRKAFGIDPYGYQVEYLQEERAILALKGRQTGFSTAASAKMIHSALYYPNSVAAIISPSQKQSTAITAIARQGLWRMGEQMEQDSESLLRLRNGSRILSLSGSARAIRGYSCRLLVVDEAAYVAEDAIVAARALVATGGQMILQSTPAGEVGQFYELWQDPEADYARFQVRSDQSPSISADWLERERRSLSAWQYAAEYEIQFIGAGASLFDSNRLATVLQGERPFFERKVSA